MGKSCGKLIPFLRNALIYKNYINLVLEDAEVFNIYLPRYQDNMSVEYHRILKDWYKENNRAFKSYSKAKAVLKAALRKSVYLISLENHGKLLRFRFANTDEIAGKKKQQKEKNAVFSYDPTLVASSDCNSDESDISFNNHTVSDQEIALTNMTMSNLDNILHNTNGESCKMDTTPLDFQEDFKITDFNLEEIYNDIKSIEGFCNYINLPNNQLSDVLDFDRENVQEDLLASLQVNSGEMNQNIAMNELDTNSSPAQVSYNDVFKKWIYINKINIGPIVQYIFQSATGNAEGQIEVSIPVEEWVADKALLNYILVYGKNLNDIFLLLFFI